MPKINNKKIVYLSYELSPSTSIYGNGEKIKFDYRKRINLGDSCNTLGIFFPNHSGTHIDFPSHFDPVGETWSNYSAGFWEFNKVKIINISDKVTDSMLIRSDLIKGPDLSGIEFLIIKTGYFNYRGMNKYTLNAPDLSEELAKWLKMLTQISDV